MRSLILAFFLCNIASAETSGPMPGTEIDLNEDLPRAHCDITSALSSEGYARMLDMRTKALSYCLVCQDGRCAMKMWPLERQAEFSLCKRLFCTPKKVPKSFIDDIEIDDFDVSFNYKISKKGRSVLVDITSLTSEASRRKMRQLLRKSLNSVRHEPLTVDGEKHEILNLSSSFSYSVRRSYFNLHR